ncbi:hydrogenase maturation nickel metallochaperone HypA [Candidatus Omnitrophota bacterium]
MHEIGVVDDILCAIKSKLNASKSTSSVRRVRMLIGELEHISPEHFTFHFRERAKGSVLENAELEFKKVEARFRCKSCHREFSAEEGLEGCPSCKSKLNDVIAGTGIHVESIEID